MDRADHVEDLGKLLLDLFFVRLGFFLVDDADASFEVANNLLVGDRAGFVDLVIDQGREPGFGKSSGLAALDRDANERLVSIREQYPIVLKLILVVLAVMEICDLRDASLFDKAGRGCLDKLLVLARFAAAYTACARACC